MKKTVETIGKALLKAVLFLVGVLAFFYAIGEPTAAWNEWASKTFGAFAGAWFVIEKLLAMAVIALCVMVAKWIDPDIFEEPASVTEE